MHLGFGLPPAERTVGAKIPILAVLADKGPIAGAEVWALVQGPNAEIKETLQLFDDGSHMDGQGDDGVYGNAFTMPKAPGQYVVKATGWGNNNSGDFFVRHRTGGFAVLPRVAYIWLNDLTTAVAYQNLLQANSYSVELGHMDDVATTNWSRYNLIVIGPEKLPRVARTVGTLLGKAQRYVNDVKAEVNRSMELDELKKMKETVESAARDVQSSVQTAATDFEKEWQEATSLAQGGLSEPPPSFPEYKLPRKKWRLKQGAVPHASTARARGRTRGAFLNVLRFIIGSPLFMESVFPAAR
jgi:sec-independent protein translocase protein TatB